MEAKERFTQMDMKKSGLVAPGRKAGQQTRSNPTFQVAYTVSSRFSPAIRIIAFCSFSKARTSIWRTRSRETL